MAQALSVVSNIAGLVTLSSAVLSAGSKYISSVSSAPEDFRSLLCETASLSSLLSQFISHCLSDQPGAQLALHTLIQQEILQGCEKTLQDVYSAIQDCEVMGGNCRKSTVNRLLWPVKRVDIVKNRERLSRLCTYFHTAVTIESAATLQMLNGKQERTNEILGELAHGADEVKEQKILDWLSSLDHTVKHTTTILQKYPGTDEWFLNEPTVLGWLNHGNFFCVYGAGGTGKTVLISGMIDRIVGSLGHKTGSDALAYHYCEFSNPSTLDPIKIVGSLVRQLAQQMDCISPSVQSLYHKHSGQPPQLDVLLQLLSQFITQTFTTTYLIIDGLDEMLNWQVLLDGIKQVCKTVHSTDSLKLLLSSRPDYGIKQTLASFPFFSIEPRHTKLAIETYLRAEIATIPQLRELPISFQSNLLSGLVNRSGGMFRWVQCQLDALRKIRTLQALEHALQALPAGLDETYDRILSSIDEQDHEYVLRMLLWLVGSDQPLSFKELAEAIALNPEKDYLDPRERLIKPEEIFELCTSLIRVQEDQTVVLAHFSVKEYLLSGHLVGKEGKLRKFALQADGSKRHISMCMLSYALSIGLRVRSLQHDVLDEEEFPLLSYLRVLDITHFQNFDAMHSWMENHLGADETTDHTALLLLDNTGDPSRQKVNCEVVKALRNIIQCSLMCVWNRYLIQNDWAMKGSALTTAMEKIESIFLHLQNAWEAPENAENVSRSYGLGFATASPLCTSAAFNFEAALRFLLRNGAQVDGIPSLHFIGNPLFRALSYGNRAIVRTLAEFGADFNIRSPRRCPGTALTKAAQYGPELVKYLVDEYRMNTNMLDNYGCTIHYWAIHDWNISRNLKPLSAFLETLREREAGFSDAFTLYRTILTLLKDVKRFSAMSDHFIYNNLAWYLFKCGPHYYDYAAALAEQNLTRGSRILHPVQCNFCGIHLGPSISGPRFSCLDCIDMDLCADHFHNWDHSKGEMDFCQGHTFFEIPRPCWYQLEQEVVMEDRSTLPDVLDFLEERFTALLNGTGA